MLDGRIAMQDLHEENLDCDNGIERRIAPLHACVTTSLANGIGRKFFRPILLETIDDIRNTSHRRGLLGQGTVTNNPSTQEAPPFLTQATL